ncbi:pyridoxal-phosphate dependent enzyme [Thermococcus sp.]|uniref:pyridoxal-phosphate dependent enzyme n=1 Tax=Thermococcus sp. TaxID=35749 RepID=UPI00345C3CFB
MRENLSRNLSPYLQLRGTLLVERNPETFTPEQFLDVRRYRRYLPAKGEVVPVPAVTPVSGLEINGVGVFFKLDYLQPSGSFKDRGTWVTVSKLLDEGITEVVLDSSGNAALSFALYGLANGIRVHAFVSYDTSPGKLSLLQRLGAVVHYVEGDRMTVHERAVEFSERSGITYVSHWLNPYFLEGTKTIAFEIYEQLGVPDWVLAPTGSGTLLLGLWKGFSELKAMGKIEELPRLVAVQASGYESICERSAVKNTLAEGIAIPEPPRLEEMRRALRETGGLCVSVGEDETLTGLRELRKLGFLVEPTSAVVYPALMKLLRERAVAPGSKVVPVLTGSGLKLT